MGARCLLLWLGRAEPPCLRQVFSLPDDRKIFDRRHAPMPASRFHRRGRHERLSGATTCRRCSLRRPGMRDGSERRQPLFYEDITWPAPELRFLGLFRSRRIVLDGLERFREVIRARSGLLLVLMRLLVDGRLLPLVVMSWPWRRIGLLGLALLGRHA